jgi:hypothetical protein
VAIEFKANAAIAQYRTLKGKPSGTAAGERPAKRGGERPVGFLPQE